MSKPKGFDLQETKSCIRVSSQICRDSDLTPEIQTRRSGRSHPPPAQETRGNLYTCANPPNRSSLSRISHSLGVTGWIERRLPRCTSIIFSNPGIDRSFLIGIISSNLCLNFTSTIYHIGFCSVCLGSGWSLFGSEAV